MKKFQSFAECLKQSATKLFYLNKVNFGKQLTQETKQKKTIEKKKEKLKN